MILNMPHSARSWAVAIAVLALVLPTQIAMGGGPGGRQTLPRPLTRTWLPPAAGDTTGRNIDYGGELRVRYVDTDKVTDLGLGTDPDPVRQFFRIRSRFWLRYRFSPTTSAYVRINNESRVYLECESCDSQFDEVIFENLYVEANQLLGLPLGARLGRQDLFYGDGFLVCDGGPLDGSRTAYVNGLVLSGSIPLVRPILMMKHFGPTTQRSRTDSQPCPACVRFPGSAICR